MLESCFVRPPARSRRTCFATPRPEMAGVDRIEAPAVEIMAKQQSL